MLYESGKFLEKNISRFGPLFQQPFAREFVGERK